MRHQLTQLRSGAQLHRSCSNAIEGFAPFGNGDTRPDTRCNTTFPSSLTRHSSVDLSLPQGECCPLPCPPLGDALELTACTRKYILCRQSRSMLGPALKCMLAIVRCLMGCPCTGMKDQTPIFNARGECIAYLLSRGADQYAWDVDGDTAFTAAIKRHDYDQVTIPRMFAI